MGAVIFGIPGPAGAGLVYVRALAPRDLVLGLNPADYATAASHRQSLPAFSRRPAITSDSLIPRQILKAAATAVLYSAGGSAHDRRKLQETPEGAFWNANS